MKIFEICHIVIGCTFLFAVSLGMIAVFVAWICNSIRSTRENRYEFWAKNVCNSIDRWCDYEFPQVGFAFRELSKSISSGWSFDVDSFREKMRRGEWKPSSPIAKPMTEGGGE